MFQPWRVKVREAEAALDDGRLEEASRLLNQAGLSEFLPAKRLRQQLAQRLAERGGRRLLGGQSMAGWEDLDQAGHLGASPEVLAARRQDFVAGRLAEIRNLLGAGESAAAMAELEQLVRHAPSDRQTRTLKDAAAKILAAHRLVHHGEFHLADEEYGKALALVQQLPGVELAREAARRQAPAARQASEQLHEATSRGDWTSVLAQAEALLDICPAHPQALAARRKAWHEVGLATDDRPRHPAVKTGSSVRGADDTAEPTAGNRFVLWVDGVGGYLVCEGNDVALGQPVPGSAVDIAILGDLSRVHARIRRDGEGYLLVPLRPARIDGKPALGVTALVDQAVLELGQGVLLQFRRPHALSQTARLDLISRHKTSPPVDGIILMAESCVLAPATSAHVPCKGWQRELVLYRAGSGLGCRTTGTFAVDGTTYDQRATISRNSRVSGEDFSLSLEPL